MAEETKSPDSNKPKGAEERRRRLAEALRRNLRRRKSAETAAGDPDAGGNDKARSGKN
jgi:hypothetical protein